MVTHELGPVKKQVFLALKNSGFHFSEKSKKKAMLIGEISFLQCEFRLCCVRQKVMLALVKCDYF